MHQRQVIREAVRDLLIAASTAASTRVVATRTLPYRKNELPAISVYTLEETVDGESVNTAPRELTRNLQLEIAGWVTAADDVDDQMDALALQIEFAMDADRYLADSAAECVLDGTTMGIQGDGDNLMGLVTLTYAVTYRTMAPEAPTDLSDFTTAAVTYNQGDAQADAAAAHDIVTVPT